MEHNVIRGVTRCGRDAFGIADMLRIDSDEGMLQYLRTERIIPPYQTRGYMLVELVRIYETGTSRANGLS